MTKTNRSTLVVTFAIAAILGWAYWPDMTDLANRWANTAEYSQGYLVPIFSALLLWHRRAQFPASAAPSGWGFAWVAMAIALHLLGAYFFVGWVSAASLVPMLIGIALALGGRQVLLWSLPSIAFLAFMLPLPYRVEVELAYPLQRASTLFSTVALQTLGFPAISEGVTITLEAGRLHVEEACSGLGMLLVFFALSTAIAIFLPNRPLDRMLVVLSAGPIALIANAVRITLHGLLADTVGMEFANNVFHEWGGWIMMPFALALLGAELAVLKRLFVEPMDVPAPFAFASLEFSKQPSANVSAIHGQSLGS
jgi:exosortase